MGPMRLKRTESLDYKSKGVSLKCEMMPYQADLR